ncbi:MAG TPA: LON peptidase substrate-binding domain-containing protein, partial [Anaerovoracaceae bacterium]|nr:LON peptidase substrate-binding domain-containing protein [Anaerovoracaceae bacterium]
MTEEKKTEEKKIEEKMTEEKKTEEKTEIENQEENGLLTLPMIPLRGLSIFPNMVLHFDIGREKSINALEKAMIMNQKVFLVTQKDENTDLPTINDFYHVGTVAKIKQMLKLPGDSIRVLVEGVCRGEIAEIIFEVPY